MDLFRPKKNKVLEDALAAVRMNMENNYKDAAQADFKKLTAIFTELKVSGKLSRKQLIYYASEIESLTAKLDHYTHADQKTAWTKEDL